MWRFNFFVIALFCLLNWRTGFASEQLKPATQDQAEFDNPVIPTEQYTPNALKSSKKPAKKQSNKEFEAKSNSESVSDAKASAPEHSQNTWSTESAEPSPHSPQAVQNPEGEDESANQTSGNAIGTAEVGVKLIDSLDTSPPLEKNYGWIWFLIVALAVLLLVFLLA